MSSIKSLKISATGPLSKISSFRKHFNRLAISISLVLIACGRQASSVGYPSTYTPQDLLENLLNGQYDANQKSIKWPATPGDLHEFNGQLSENSALYSFVDTTMIINREDEKVYYTIFRTAPMLFNEDGQFTNASNCHVCGVNLGYFSYTIENDSIHVQKFKRNFAKHGTFGQKTYSVSMINLGNGYELIKVDDPYEGMGIASVSTRFYQDGDLVLSLISKENNHGNKSKFEKGYYEFETRYGYNDKAHTITIQQTGYEIDEQSGTRLMTNKMKILNFDSYTLQF